MNTYFLGFALVLAASASLAAPPPPPSPAPQGSVVPHQRMMSSGHGQNMMVDMLARELKLDQGQRQQLERVIDETRTAAAPLHEQMQKLRAQMREALLAGKSEADVRELSDKTGATFARIHEIQNNAFRQILTGLNEEQRKQGELLYDALSMATAGGSRPRTAMPALPSGHPPVRGQEPPPRR